MWPILLRRTNWPLVINTWLQNGHFDWRISLHYLCLFLFPLGNLTKWRTKFWVCVTKWANISSRGKSDPRKKISSPVTNCSSATSCSTQSDQSQRGVLLWRFFIALPNHSSFALMQMDKRTFLCALVNITSVVNNWTHLCHNFKPVFMLAKNIRWLK